MKLKRNVNALTTHTGTHPAPIFTMPSPEEAKANGHNFANLTLSPPQPKATRPSLIFILILTSASAACAGWEERWRPSPPPPSSSSSSPPPPPPACRRLSHPLLVVSPRAALVLSSVSSQPEKSLCSQAKLRDQHHREFQQHLLVEDPSLDRKWRKKSETRFLLFLLHSSACKKYFFSSFPFDKVWHWYNNPKNARVWDSS